MTVEPATSNGWRTWLRSPRGFAVAVSVIAGLLFELGWFEFVGWRVDQRRAAARTQVELALSARSRALASAVERRLALLSGLRAFVELELDSGQLARKFPAYASRIASGVPGLRNVAVSRGSVYELVYPVAGNERIVGYDLLTDARPEVREDTRQVLSSDRMIVSGPLQLLQGGAGLIARRSIRQGGRIWGLVAIVIDLAPVLREAGLDPSPASLQIAARIVGRPPFSGRDEGFADDAVRVTVPAAWARWELTGQAAGGWRAQFDYETRLWTALGLALGLVPAGLVFVLAWRQRMRRAYHLETERLVEERTAALARSSLIVENSPVVLVRWRPGPGWPVEYVSENIAQYGYSAESFQSGRLRWGDIMFPDDRVRLEGAPPADERAGMHLPPQEYRIVAADGSVRWVEDRTTVIGDTGMLVHQGILVDITERKHREGVQREAEQRLRDILDRVEMLAVMLDVSGHVTFCNTCLLRVTGWNRDEIDGAAWLDLFVPPSHRPAAREYFERVLRTDTFDGSHENPIVTRDGSLREIVWDGVSVRDSSGQVVGLAAFGRDMTEHRQLESQYRQAQKMEAVGQLAGGVAHDFNNLLQVIGGYANLLLEELKPDAPLHAELTEIQKATDRASTLVRQLLAFSRRQTMERRLIHPNDTVSDLLKMLHRLIGEHIELAFVPGRGVPDVVADPGQIEQVLVNLCVNSRDAMPDGGRLTISTTGETVDDEFCSRHQWARAGTFLVVEVADTGPGIPPDILERIFEPFFTTKEVGKGTGLGLATVYGIVKQHDGMIDVVSRPGEGAVFRIFLPAGGRASARSDVPAEPIPESEGGHETILLAEDEELVRRLATRVLERAGYRVLVARDGAEAIALIEEGRAPIDLALLDVVMPKVNGPQVRARIRELQPGAAVLFCSGYSRQVLDNSAIPDDEGVELLVKPYAPRLLLERVRSLLARARATGHREPPSGPRGRPSPGRS